MRISMRISRKNWEASKEKWEKIIEKLKQEVPFDCPDGWDEVHVFNNCGYCDEFDCDDCLLNKKVCEADATRSRMAFWRFTRAVTKKAPTGSRYFYVPRKNPDFTKALEYANKIYNAILADEPNVYEEE
jgi:hypothetical protein